MITKIKQLFKLNNLVLLGALILAAILVIDTFQAIHSNYQLSQQYDAMQSQIDVLKLTNQNLKLTNQYLESNDYLELAVRDKLDKGAPGDKELIFTHLPAPASNQSAKNTSKKSNTHIDHWRQNISDWLDFLLHRKTN